MFARFLRVRVNGGTVNFNHPTIHLSFPRLSHLLSLPLSAVPNHCLCSCLSPLQKKKTKKHLAGDHRHTQTYTFFPGSDVVQEVMILVHCRLLFSGNIYFLKRNHSTVEREPLSLAQGSKLVESAK